MSGPVRACVLSEVEIWEGGHAGRRTVTLKPGVQATARPLEHVQLSTNGGGELSTAVTLLLSKFSSVDLRSTDVTLFT